MVKKFIFIFFIFIAFVSPSLATTYTGGVTKVGQQESNRIIDSKTKQGIDFAKITIPQKKVFTYSDANGNFELPQIKVTQPLIMNIEKEGYRPFSITINNNSSLQSPMKIEIVKSEAFDLALDTEILHLGDNSFSKNSANASDFRTKSVGASYSKDFVMSNNAKKHSNYLVIGSIVGVDTMLAKQMRQNNIKTQAYSSPTEIYFNGNKIGEIKINGDGQRVKIPSNLIKADAQNQITIKTGQNTMPVGHIDYDDIEIMNISILTE